MQRRQLRESRKVKFSSFSLPILQCSVNMDVANFAALSNQLRYVGEIRTFAVNSNFDLNHWFIVPVGFLERLMHIIILHQRMRLRIALFKTEIHFSPLFYDSSELA